MTPDLHPLRLSISDIRARKNSAAPLVCLTAYSAPMAQLLDPHCDILLVGDSMGMALYGMDNTLTVTLDMLIAHGRAVMRKRRKACVLVDMPYDTYEQSSALAYQNALRLMTETGCDGVKLEGGREMQETIAHLSSKGIPVMAHIGLKPQSVLKEGGYKIKGKTPDEADALIEDARAVEAAGAFAILIEGTVEPVARAITLAVSIPTIGIGASPACDGQILVTEDLLGLTVDHTPKFVKTYANLGKIITDAVSSYAEDVRVRAFPDESHVYKADAKTKT
ncbi:MAG: 3-methyl-2-oxobutanoate hydroxymethyltransferase [Alphaproteobacteria bacterium]|nr:3-methyl-2-oxobutanoate hydroxymethyltransferase [Alphaproteobacteria bacterium]MBP7758240.1 3-methyl-2-oxobutanoate hydroxymethyltransferase [Alphaproteobacteria bacterium]MBP7761617.1 3-methyl-2-oxobutanoate hydroxymethyltransferase [Alphaproteobacteria bacterium]MBP7904031.1 3-methyl-2-oxobutanoate hydroxymethyltransferase [Alphaproteobacteria bacterium]